MSGFFNFFQSFLSGLSKKEKIIFYLTCLVLFLLLFDKIIYSPISSRIKGLEDKILIQKNLIKKNLAILEYEKSIMAEREEYKDYFSRPGLSREERISNFLSSVEEIARASGVTLVNTDPVEVKEEQGFSLYQLTVEYQAPMENVLRFIYSLDSASEPLRAVSFEVSPRNRPQYAVQGAVTIERLMIIPIKQENLFSE